MKILHVANSDSGGAANAMLNLHKSLMNYGIDSKVLVLHRKTDDSNIVPFLSNRNWIRIIKDSISYRIFDLKRKYFRRQFSVYENFSYFNGPYNLYDHALTYWADIIHLHWYHNFINLDGVFSNLKKPIIMTLHDENIFLGGFHYSFDKFNAPVSAQKIDDKFRLFKARIVRSNPKAHFIAPSKWLFNFLEQNQYKHIHYIPYGIDTRRFKFVERHIARKKLGIKDDYKVYLLLADHLSSKRKGISNTINAFLQLKDPDLMLLVVGIPEKKIVHSQIRYLGYVNGAEDLSIVYSAGDVFVNPTLADNLPNTVLESLACGTPVIGFSTGGMSDMINISNGVLLESGDFNAIFDRHIFQILKKLDRNLIISNCADIFSLKNQMSKHKALYQSLIE